MPRISVIMPAYNAEAYIGEAIDSILAQTFSDFELFVLDDGSSDSTPEIIESYTDPRVRLVRNPHNMGVARTLNRGLDLASGEYVARMDADDIALPERFARQVAFMDAHPEVAVCGCGIEHFGAQKRIHIFSSSYEQLKVDLLFENCLAHPSVMMRAALFGGDGYRYDPEFSRMEDYELWCRVAEKHVLAALPDVLLRYRIHANQITQNPTVEDISQRTRLCHRFLSALDLESEPTADACYISYCIGQYKISCKSVLTQHRFFKALRKKNKRIGIYNSTCLRKTLSAVTYAQLSKIPLAEAISLLPHIGIGAAIHLCKRGVKKFIGRYLARRS